MCSHSLLTIEFLEVYEYCKTDPVEHFDSLIEKTIYNMDLKHRIYDTCTANSFDVLRLYNLMVYFKDDKNKFNYMRVYCARFIVL